MHQREDAFGLQHVAEALRAEVTEDCPVRQRPTQLIHGVSDEPRLATTGQLHERTGPTLRSGGPVAPRLSSMA